jgi:hypothetical protein
MTSSTLVWRRAHRCFRELELPTASERFIALVRISQTRWGINFLSTAAGLSCTGLPRLRRASSNGIGLTLRDSFHLFSTNAATHVWKCSIGLSFRFLVRGSETSRCWLPSGGEESAAAHGVSDGVLRLLVAIGPK